MSRAQCSVPGCKATTGRFQTWICSRHWARLTKAERRVWSRLRRFASRHGWHAQRPRIDRIWDALVRRAGEGL